MTAEFADKTGIVTGGGSGIGAAIARRLGAEGCRVIVVDLDPRSAERVVQEIEATGGIAVAAQLDVTDPVATEACVSQAEQSWGGGGLQIAVNNAGLPGCMDSLADHTVAEWQKVIGVNLSGVFYGMKYQLAAMLRSGGGAIVNIASIFGVVGTAGSAAYTAAKHGVVGLTKSAALDYAQHGIRVNSVGPGFIDTPLLGGVDETTRQQLGELHPMGRLGRAKEVAELTSFLLSDRASFITGSHHAIDGGYTAR